MISLEVTYTKSDYVRVLKFMTRRRNVISSGLILVGAVVIGLLLFRANSGEFWWFAALMAVVWIVLFSFLVPFIQRRNIGKQLKSAPSSQGPHIWGDWR